MVPGITWSDSFLLGSLSLTSWTYLVCNCRYFWFGSFDTICFSKWLSSVSKLNIRLMPWIFTEYVPIFFDVCSHWIFYFLVLVRITIRGAHGTLKTPASVFIRKRHLIPFILLYEQGLQFYVTKQLLVVWRVAIALSGI